MTRLFNFVLLAASAILPSSLACSPDLNARDANGKSPFVIGDDGHADPETLGYNINHFALNSNNLAKTQHFYGEVLGMRHVFTYHASENYTVMYMGYPAGGKNGTGFQTGDELYAEKNNAQGLIEFLNVRGAEPLPASTHQPNTFSHVGLIVPDLKKTARRFERMGAKILKPIGAKPAVHGPIANAFGLVDRKESLDALPGIIKLGFTEFLVATDPDGNLLEIQQQVSEVA